MPRSRGHSGAPAKENLPKLEESLNAFRNDRFDPQSYVQSKCSLNEKVFFNYAINFVFALANLNFYYLIRVIFEFYFEKFELPNSR